MAWSLVGAAFDSGQSFSVGSQAPFPTDVFFKSDGTKFWVLSVDPDRVFQYSCSTPWDLTTASYDSVFFSLGLSPHGLDFKTDGSKMFMADAQADVINEYALSSAWNVSTASFTASLSLPTIDQIVGGIQWKPDGSKLFITGRNNLRIYERSASTAWDITATSATTSFLASIEGNIEAAAFKADDGTKMFIIWDSGNIREYNLSTAWDVSSATLVNTFSTSSQHTSARAIFLKPDGEKFFTVGEATSSIYRYSMGAVATRGLVVGSMSLG